MIASQEVNRFIPGLAAVVVFLLGAAFFSVSVRGIEGEGIKPEVKSAVNGEGRRSMVDDRITAKAARQPPKSISAQSGVSPPTVPVIEKALLKYCPRHRAAYFDERGTGYNCLLCHTAARSSVVGERPYMKRLMGRSDITMNVADVTVDARRHCLYIGQPPASGQGALRIDLEKGVTYTVGAAGEAFMSEETGADADPFPGIVLYYSTDVEDGYAVRYTVLKPGDSVKFNTPSQISPKDEVFAIAFFLDAWSDSENRGSYTLTITR
jgi:hypothetical protein